MESEKYLWIPSEKQAWVPAKLVGLHKGGKKLIMSLKDGKEFKVEGPESKYEIVDMSTLDEDCENLADLDSFNEGLILHHVKNRFARGTIYTNVGNILISVNPYRALDIYGDSLKAAIWTRSNSAIDNNVVPHVFSIGAQALQQLQSSNKSQSILISGESGAGKTEATKKILDFISSQSASANTESDNNSEKEGSRSGPTGVASQIMESNPILESFGNAKTIRNNNSSRFGKYMLIIYNPQYEITGCEIQTYLLEKTRVVRQAANERSYHVFYMMLAGASKEMKKEFGLKDKDVEYFNYLNTTGCTKIKDRAEKKEYVALVEAFDKLKFDGGLIKYIFQLLAAVLHLGNLVYEESLEGDGEGCDIVDADVSVALIAQLLGIHDVSKLIRALRFKTVTINGTETDISLPVESGIGLRDTLAKHIYSKIFHTIVDHVDASLQPGSSDKSSVENSEAPSRSKRSKSIHAGDHPLNIGILDIFGFEVFENNSFEQLCINYCNERLQTFFNNIVFAKEIEFYENEGIDTTDITYVNNLECIALLDAAKGKGIFSLLDEEGVVPQGSDEKLLSKMNKAFARDSSSTFNNYYRPGPRSKPTLFEVKHFAGGVSYTVTGFIDKNSDTLQTGLSAVLATSMIDMVNDDNDIGEKESGDKKKNAKATVGAQFVKNLNELMDSLSHTESSFVRCVKPNETQRFDKFDSNAVLNQLKYSGLFEAIRIRKAGYATRMSLLGFIYRYKMCIPFEHWTRLRILKDPRKVQSGTKRTDECRRQAQAIIDTLPSIIDNELVSKADGKNKFAVGDSKVFFRTNAIYNLVESHFMTHVFPEMVKMIQRAIRHYLGRGKFERLAAMANARRKEDRKNEQTEINAMMIEDVQSQAEELRYKAALIKVRQAAEAKRLRLLEEERALQMKKMAAVVKVQSIIRGFIGRMKARIYICETMFEKALMQRDENALRSALHTTDTFGVHSKALSTFQKSAKRLILDVLSESHVANGLSEAIASDSQGLLQDAITSAEESRMQYLPEYEQALSALKAHRELREGLVWLQTELDKANDVPEFMESVDYIQRLLKEANSKGLQNERVCRSAVIRLGKVKRLISVRNKIRFEVEIASLTGMISALKEREEYVDVFGEDIFREEVEACENMGRMINLVPHFLSTKEIRRNFGSETGSTNDDADSEGEEDDLLTTMKSTKNSGDIDNDEEEGESKQGGDSSVYDSDDVDEAVKRGMEKARSGAKGVSFLMDNAQSLKASNNDEDALLPTWVRSIMLQQRKYAHLDQDKYMEVTRDLHRMVPSAELRKQYATVFKWTVSFCTWMLTTPKHKHQNRLFGNKNLSSREEELALFEEEGGVTGGATSASGRRAGSVLAEEMKKLNLSKNAGAEIDTSVYRGRGKGPVDKWGRDIKKAKVNLGVVRGGGQGSAFAPPKTNGMTPAEKAAEIKKREYTCHDILSYPPPNYTLLAHAFLTSSFSTYLFYCTCHQLSM